MSESQYALVKDGALVMENDAPVVSRFMSQAPDDYSSRFPDGCQWLPVESVDSRPFSVATDARLPPVFEVAGGVVRRVYQIQKVR